MHVGSFSFIQYEIFLNLLMLTRDVKKVKTRLQLWRVLKESLRPGPSTNFTDADPQYRSFRALIL